MSLIQSMRWYGPQDVVSLEYIRQAGCRGVVTALHQIPVGDIWTVDEINHRKALIEAAGLSSLTISCRCWIGSVPIWST